VVKTSAAFHSITQNKINNEMMTKIKMAIGVFDWGANFSGCRVRNSA
jgi:hypothetical protein